jgi:hypothetical protein
MPALPVVRLKLSVTDSRATKSAGMPRTPNASRGSGATVVAPAFGVRGIPALSAGDDRHC